MNENTYLIGSEICYKVSFFISIASFIFLYIKFLYIKSQKPKNDDSDDSSFFSNLERGLGLPVSFGIGISTFSIIYPIINLLSQDFLSIAFYKNDMSQGSLILRITSITLGYKSLISFSNNLVNKFSENNEKLTVDYPDLYNLKSFLNNNSINLIILTQNLIYGVFIVSLWWSKFNSISRLEFQVITWGLFFIIDDWAIISDNMIALKGRLLKMHKLRITFFNFLLFIFLFSACLKELNTLSKWLYITMFFGLIIFNTIKLYPKTFNK